MDKRLLIFLSRTAFTIAMMLGFWAPQVSALPVCQSATLDVYLALNAGGGCTVGNATLFNFSFSATPPVGAPPPSASSVGVTPEASSPSNGLGFASSLFNLSNNAQPDIATYMIDYTVDPPPIYVGEDLNVDPPFGDLKITQNVCLSDTFANGCSKGTFLTQYVTPLQPSSYLTFPYPVNFLDIQTIISLRSEPGIPAGFDSVSAGSVANPEPASLALAFAGFLVLSGLAQRARKHVPANFHRAD